MLKRVLVVLVFMASVPWSALVLWGGCARPAQSVSPKAGDVPVEKTTASKAISKKAIPVKKPVLQRTHQEGQVEGVLVKLVEGGPKNIIAREVKVVASTVGLKQEAELDLFALTLAYSEGSGCSIGVVAQILERGGRAPMEAALFIDGVPFPLGALQQTSSPAKTRFELVEDVPCDVLVRLQNTPFIVQVTGDDEVIEGRVSQKGRGQVDLFAIALDEIWAEAPAPLDTQVGEASEPEAVEIDATEELEPEPASAWDVVCQEPLELYPLSCFEKDTKFERAHCLKLIEKRKKQRAFYQLEDTFYEVDFNVDKDRYEVVLTGILYGNLDGECNSLGCVRSTISTGRLALSKSTTTRGQWIQRTQTTLRGLDKPLKTFFVPASEVQDPGYFERNLTVDALVQVLDDQQFVVGDWLYLENVQIRVVGLRAYLPDGSFEKTIQAPPKSIKRMTCPED